METVCISRQMLRDPAVWASLCDFKSLRIKLRQGVIVTDHTSFSFVQSQLYRANPQAE